MTGAAEPGFPGAAAASASVVLQHVTAGGHIVVAHDVVIADDMRWRRENPVEIGAGQALLRSLPVDRVPETGQVPLGSLLSFGPNPLFVGRSAQMRAIATEIKRESGLAAITGIAGLGKTQLAVECAHRYGRYFAGGVFWLSFASREEVALQIAACGGPGFMALYSAFESFSHEERLALVLAAWRSAIPRLLIFDNCEDEDLLAQWRPASGGCRVLVTARRSGWSPVLGLSRVPLAVLSRPQSVELLRKYRPQVPAQDRDLADIAEEVGDLPLAVHLAGSFLHRYDSTITAGSYLAQLRDRRPLEHASLLGRNLTPALSPTRHSQSVAETFALSYRNLDVDDPTDVVALRLLARAAYFAPGRPLPRDLLVAALGPVPDPDAELQSDDALARLVSLGLLSQSDRYFQMHRLLALFVLDQNPGDEAIAAVEDVLVECGEVANRGLMSTQERLTVLPHLRNAADRALARAADEPAAALCHSLGLVFWTGGDLQASQLAFRQALDIHLRVLGEASPRTASSMKTLAWLLHDLGDFAAARPWFERALAIYERVLGPEHPDTAGGLNGLAVLLFDQGDLAAARPLFERALRIKERSLDPDDPTVATSLDNQASLLTALGEPASARPLAERALDIRERVLGPDHPYTAISVNTLAVVLAALDDMAGARQLFERALAIRERVLEPDHPETAISLESLADLSQAQGDRASAQRLLARALAIRERVLGSGHPDTTRTRAKLARSRS